MNQAKKEGSACQSCLKDGESGLEVKSLLHRGLGEKNLRAQRNQTSVFSALS